MVTTIDQVAKKAGVSKATVSRVLNDSKPVREETRQRVMQAIKELDFKPNPAARSLVSKKSRIIGVIVTDIANLFVSVLVKGIEDIAYSKNYNIFICNSHGSAQKEVKLLQMLKNKRVDGIIFLTSQLISEHKSFFQKSALPISLVNVSYDGNNIIGVRIDNRKAAYDITCYFLQKGHRHIGMIRAPLEDLDTGKERFLGYCQALQEYGLSLNEELIATGDLEAQDGYRLTSALLKNNKPDAFVVACDLMAFGVIKAIFDQGYNVPEDIEVAGFDDVPMASYYNPTLTTVRQPIEEMGQLAAEKLIKLIEGEGDREGEMVLPYQIIFRQSTNR